MKVSVVGLGYVGAVTAACLARDGHDVLGIDLDPKKLELITSGKAPIVEEDIQQVTAEAVASGRLTVLDRVDDRISDCELIFVCVGTPSASNGSQNITAVKRVTEEIGIALISSEIYNVIVIRSTVYPGVTEEILTPILETVSGKGVGTGLGLCFQPEFLREGSSVRDFYSPPFTVIGGDSDQSIAVVERLFSDLPAEFVSTDIRSAELLKLACNAFHSLKICFANEIGRLGRSLGVDGRIVMDLLCKDTSLNISTAYLRPGYAFGGSCLPKDLRALLHLAKTNDVDVPLLSGTLASNVDHISHAAKLVTSFGVRKVGFVGLSFKPGTDDLRESPLVTLAEFLIGKGYELKIFDPAVNTARLIGANKQFIENTIPHFGSMLTEDVSDVLEHAEVVIMGHHNDVVSKALASAPEARWHVVDLIGILDDLPAKKNYEGICW